LHATEGAAPGRGPGEQALVNGTAAPPPLGDEWQPAAATVHRTRTAVRGRMGTTAYRSNVFSTKTQAAGAAGAAGAAPPRGRARGAGGGGSGGGRGRRDGGAGRRPARPRRPPGSPARRRWPPASAPRSRAG